MPATARRKPRSRGQIVVIFAISVMAFVGLCAIVIDVSWYWANSLRMQRAADAAALAGVIRLPADFAGATTLARAESKKNGYENGVNGVSVTPVQDPSNNRRLRVTITADIGTFFARVIGVNSFHTSRSSKAEYVLPGPDGQPGELLRDLRDGPTLLDGRRRHGLQPDRRHDRVHGQHGHHRPHDVLHAARRRRPRARGRTRRAPTAAPTAVPSRRPPTPRRRRHGRRGADSASP